MKIVMLCDLYDDRFQYQENLLTKYYVKQGHTVTVIASTFRTAADFLADRYDPDVPGSEYQDQGATIIKLPYSLNILNKLRKFGGVDAILERERPDLIFVHDIHLNLPEAAAYKRRNPGCRIIMDYHADYTNSAKNWVSLNILHKVIRKRILYRHLKSIDQIYPVVPASAVFLTEVYGIPAGAMELLPLGADTDLAEQARAAQLGRAVRRTLGIPDNAIVVFSGGKLVPLKRTHLLLEAVNELADSDVHVLLIGAVPEGNDEYARELARLSEMNPRVHRTGWVEGIDVYRYMDACDLAVFPASQSVLWQQALSMGLPLIVGEGTHLGGQDPSYMNLHDNMVILPQEQIRAEVIASEIAKMAGDRAILARRRAGALRAADELLNYDSIVRKTLSFNS